MKKDFIPGIDYVGITTPFYCNDEKGNFLFHKRSKKCRDEQGRWDTGAGKLDYGLKLEENVLKEIVEEYGVKGTIQEQIPTQTILREQNGILTHWIAVPFFVLVDPKKVTNNEPEKIEALGWYRLDNLPFPLHSGFEKCFNEYNEYFKKYM